MNRVRRLLCRIRGHQFALRDCRPYCLRCGKDYETGDTPYGLLNIPRNGR